jgi:hypothetical protein
MLRLLVPVNLPFALVGTTLMVMITGNALARVHSRFYSSVWHHAPQFDHDDLSL